MDIKRNRFATRMPVDLLFCNFYICICHDKLPSLFFAYIQQVFDKYCRRSAGSQQKYFLHYQLYLITLFQRTKKK